MATALASQAGNFIAKNPQLVTQGLNAVSSIMESKGQQDQSQYPPEQAVYDQRAYQNNNAIMQQQQQLQGREIQQAQISAQNSTTTQQLSRQAQSQNMANQQIEKANRDLQEKERKLKDKENRVNKQISILAQKTRIQAEKKEQDRQNKEATSRNPQYVKRTIGPKGIPSARQLVSSQDEIPDKYNSDDSSRMNFDENGQTYLEDIPEPESKRTRREMITSQ